MSRNESVRRDRTKEKQLTARDYSKYNFRSETSAYKEIFEKGINEEIVRKISAKKNEPEWMLKQRLLGLEAFQQRPLPEWGADLRGIDFDDITYYMKPTEKAAESWDDVPKYIKDTFERIGIPEAERKYLAGVSTQYESEVVYHSIRDDLEKQGVVFLGMDDGLKEHPELVEKHFGTVIPFNDNKFAALNTAAWSGGSFVYVPKNTSVDIPLQAYFRINAERMGQFERTLIIADEGSKITYVEGCTAPQYSSNSLHAAVVELIALPESHLTYTTIQNWSNNIYNLVTKRAVAYRNAEVHWIDGNLGSKVTMKYPSIHLKGEGAKGEVLSVAMAGKGQHQDAGAKIIHFAPNTTSKITSKSISKEGGRASYRGLLKVIKGAKNVKSSVVCDALMLDENSRSDTYPTIEIDESTATIAHEATVGRVGEDQLFYLMSRGLSEQEALTMVVMGFIKPFVKSLPMEYAIELNRLIEMEMEGCVG